MKTGIIKTEESTYQIKELIERVFVRNPRKAAIAASVMLSEKGVRHELIEERAVGYQHNYLIVDENGKAIRFHNP